METGISDQHKQVTTMLRSTFAKGPSKFLCYRLYKNYDKNVFKKALKKPEKLYKN